MSGSFMLMVFVLFVLVMLSAACSDANPAAPVTDPTVQSPMATVAQIADFVSMLSDERARLLPALQDRTSANRLNTELTGLESALNSRSQPAAMQHITVARAVLAAYPAVFAVEDGVELSGIEILLDRAVQLANPAAMVNPAIP
jgi:hypothetical protein